jgi:hypothetical protein
MVDKRQTNVNNHRRVIRIRLYYSCVRKSNIVVIKVCENQVKQIAAANSIDALLQVK